MLNANGGFARYQPAIEPALAMLAFRRDSWVFENASVIDILPNCSSTIRVAPS